MDSIVQLNTSLFIGNRNINIINRNNSHFKYKYIILNIVSIILYVFFSYYFYKKQHFISSEKNSILINKRDIKPLSLKDYRKKFYEVTRETYLYEKQKKLIFSSLVDKNFKGAWESKNATNNENNIKSGESIIYFEKAFEIRTGKDSIAINIKNKNGKYIDSWIKILLYCKYNSLNKIANLENKTFELSGQFMTEFEKGEIFETKYKQKKCKTSLKMVFPLKYIDVNASTIDGKYVYLGKMGIINNSNFTMKLESNCGFKFNIIGNLMNELKEKEINQGKINIYLYINLFTAILYGTGIIVLYCGIKNNESYILTINIEIFSINTIWNIYCSASNIYIAFKINFDLIINFLSIGLLCLLKFLSFDMIIYSTFWGIKERRISNYCQLIKIKLRFYLFISSFIIISFFFLSNFYVNYSYILLLSLLLWIPQIIYNIISNNKYGYPFIYLLSSSINIIIYPFYFRAFKFNYFELNVNYAIFSIFIFIIFFSIIILLLQMFIGSRFMLSDKYQEKNTYEFYKDIDEIKNIFKDINEECVICLMPIYPDNNNFEMADMKDENKINNNNEQTINSIETNISDNNKLLVKEEDKNIVETNTMIYKKKNKLFRNFLFNIKILFTKNFFHFYRPSSNHKNKPYMLTPCKHVFHSECLDKWLEQKKECPNCRKSFENYI